MRYDKRATVYFEETPAEYDVATGKIKAMETKTIVCPCVISSAGKSVNNALSDKLELGAKVIILQGKITGNIARLDVEGVSYTVTQKNADRRLYTTLYCNEVLSHE